MTSCAGRRVTARRAAASWLRRTHLPAEVFEAATKLRLVAKLGEGVDNIALTDARRRGVAVMSSASRALGTAAEGVLALMLATARDVPRMVESLKAGRWEKGPHVAGTELRNKTLGLLGVDPVGQHVVHLAKSLGCAGRAACGCWAPATAPATHARARAAGSMRVVAFDPSLTAERAVGLGVEKARAARRAPPRSRRAGDRCLSALRRAVSARSCTR